MNFEQLLDERQYTAVRAAAGPVLVAAAAGSGKTRTLTHRLAWLVEHGVPARSICAITFTTRAAGEMRARATCQADLGAIWIGTLHALGYEILHSLTPDTAPVIIAPALRLSLIRAAAQATGQQTAGMRSLDLAISRAKQSCLPPDTLPPLAQAYERLLAERGMLDFDDLIRMPTVALRDDPRAAGWTTRFSHLCVDEFQDLNPAQYRFIRNLCGSRANLFAVGDADQSIYGFRGAQVRQFLEFSRDFPDALTVHLSRNYRSTATIVSAAHHLIQHNRQRIETGMEATQPAGNPIRLLQCADEHAEGRVIADEIEALVGGMRLESMQDGADESVGFADIAVLYRRHTQAAALRRALSRRGIPVQVAADRRLYERSAVRPLISLLCLAVRPEDTAALEGLLEHPSCNPGTAAVPSVLAAAASAGLSVIEWLRLGLPGCALPATARTRVALLEPLLTDLQLHAAEPLDRLAQRAAAALQLDDETDVADLLTDLLRFAHLPAADGLPLFLHRIALLEDGESTDSAAEAVTMMTIHGAKGLEFPVVFVAGCEEGILPADSASDTAIEEERRLCYVAMTRARRTLIMTSARQRTIFGIRREQRDSRFLGELPPDTLQRSIKRPRPRRQPSRTNQLSLFES